MSTITLHSFGVYTHHVVGMLHRICLFSGPMRSHWHVTGQLANETWSLYSSFKQGLGQTQPSHTAKGRISPQYKRVSHTFLDIFGLILCNVIL